MQPLPIPIRPRNGPHSADAHSQAKSHSRAIPTRRGKYSCPSTTSTLVGMKIKMASGARNAIAQFWSEAEMKRARKTTAPPNPSADHRSAAKAVGQPTADDCSEDACSQKNDKWRGWRGPRPLPNGP